MKLSKGISRMDIEQKIKELIAKQLDQKLEDIQPNSNLIQDLKADSLDIVELVMSFEETFNIEIADEEAEKMLTVANIVNYIKKHK